MMKIIRKNERYFSDMWDMNSYFLFSFANYYDKENEMFWNLRVFNDDFLEGNSGFWFHPHKYYEILTLMLDWTITHKDSLWNHIKVKKNQIQVTNTSTWIMHSEINEESESLKLYQIWFMPEDMAPKPIYYTATFENSDFENNLFTLASWIQENENKLSSKITIKRWIFEKWKKLELTPEKYFFVYLTNWSIKVNNDIILNEKDQLRATDENKIEIEFLENTDFVIIDSL